MRNEKTQIKNTAQSKLHQKYKNFYFCHFLIKALCVWQKYASKQVLRTLGIEGFSWYWIREEWKDPGVLAFNLQIQNSSGLNITYNVMITTFDNLE